MAQRRGGLSAVCRGLVLVERPTTCGLSLCRAAVASPSSAVLSSGRAIVHTNRAARRLPQLCHRSFGAASEFTVARRLGRQQGHEAARAL